jgi:hypothetical protein
MPCNVEVSGDNAHAYVGFARGASLPDRDRLIGGPAKPAGCQGAVDRGTREDWDEAVAGGGG